MTEGRGWNWQAVGVVLSLLTSMVTCVFLFAETRGNVERNTKDIAQLQVDSRVSSRELSEINEKLGRIETRMEILLPTSAIKDSHR